MKKLTIAFLFWSLTLTAAQVGVRKPRTAPSKTAVAVPKTTIQGDVFVVTKGAQNIRLGLVEVRAIEKKTIRQYLDDKKKNAEQEIATLMPQLEAAEQNQQQTDAADKEANKKRDAILRASGKSMEQMTALYHQLKIATQEVLDTSRLSVEAGFAAGRLRRQMNYFKSGTYYFADLPNGIASTKTDADGKFEIEITGKIEFCIAAQAQREIGEKKENYHWLVWPSNAKRLFLSNDNLTTVPSSDSLIFTKE